MMNIVYVKTVLVTLVLPRLTPLTFPLICVITFAFTEHQNLNKCSQHIFDITNAVKTTEDIGIQKISLRY